MATKKTVSPSTLSEDTTGTTVIEPVSTVTPGFFDPNIVASIQSLATADAEARAASADSTQARGKRSIAATDLILSAHNNVPEFAKDAHKGDFHVKSEEFRIALLDAGVIKGTVSKIITVLTALNTGFISSQEVASLNGAYTVIKNREKAIGATLQEAAKIKQDPTLTTLASGKPLDQKTAIAFFVNKIAASKNPRQTASDLLVALTDALGKAATSSEDAQGISTPEV